MARIDTSLGNAPGSQPNIHPRAEGPIYAAHTPRPKHRSRARFLNDQGFLGSCLPPQVASIGEPRGA